MLLKPRQQKPLLQRLPPKQAGELRRWLLQENVTYAVAKARLAQRFGVTTGSQQLSKFYQSIARPAPSPLTAPLLDIRFTKCAQNSWRVRVLARSPRVHLFFSNAKIKRGTTEVHL